LILFFCNEIKAQTWFAVYNKSNSVSSWAYEYRPNLSQLEAAIKQRGNNGFNIVDVSYGNGTWFAVFNKSTRVSGWAYDYRSSLPQLESVISKTGNNGYNLIGVNFQ